MAKTQLLDGSDAHFKWKKREWLQHSVLMWNPLAPPGSEEAKIPVNRRWGTLASLPSCCCQLILTELVHLQAPPPSITPAPPLGPS